MAAWRVRAGAVSHGEKTGAAAAAARQIGFRAIPKSKLGNERKIAFKKRRKFAPDDLLMSEFPLHKSNKNERPYLG